MGTVLDLHIERLPNYIKRFGPIKGTLLFAKVHLAVPRDHLFAINVGKFRIWLRRTPSDTSIFFQVFVKQEYDTREWAQDKILDSHYQRIVQNGRTPVIIDAGANIGLSALWFADRYPKAKIYAIEPDRNNVQLLERNSLQAPAIVPIHAAVWDREVELRIENPSAGAGAFRVIEGIGPLRGMAISKILAMEKSSDLFIVKIDIEGGESALFRSNTEWIREAKLVVVELHDWLFPGQRTSAPFLKAIASIDIDFLARGENFFCFKS